MAWILCQHPVLSQLLQLAIRGWKRLHTTKGIGRTGILDYKQIVGFSKARLELLTDINTTYEIQADQNGLAAVHLMKLVCEHQAELQFTWLLKLIWGEPKIVLSAAPFVLHLNGPSD